MKCVMTIASTDSSCGAGVNVDLAVFRDHGVHGLCAVASVTAQDSRGVHRICKLPPRVVAAQIDSGVRDFGVDACKIGMLYSPQAVELVAERIKRREIPNVVLDPVMKAKNGEVLLTEPAIKRLKWRLIRAVSLVTPNAIEAEILTGIRVIDKASAAGAAKALVEMGAKAALVKGGHIEGDPVDVLYDGSDTIEFTGARIEKTMHGTGCVLSAAIAARLAQGESLREAVASAREYVTQAIGRSTRLGKGAMDYFT